jgi:hypothetical protein
MNGACYKGFTITARTYQIRGSGRWTLDLLIGHHELLRAFTGPHTYGSEAAAVAGCVAFAHALIDRNPPGCPLADLTEALPLARPNPRTQISRPDRGRTG